MDILNSPWFLRMLEKSGSSPRQHMLALFEILGDWLDAPHLRETLTPIHQAADIPPALLEYLTAQAKAAGANDHELLAQQLCLMARNLLHEELRTPGCAAAQQGKQAAQALIKAQTEKDFRINKRTAYAMAAGVFTMATTGGLLLFSTLEPAPAMAPVPVIVAQPAAFQINPESASPEQTASLLAAVEQMRKGTCQFPEALMLPENQKGIYIENVVAGQVPSKAKDQEVAGQLMSKVRCNYTPQLMAHSTG